MPKQTYICYRCDKRFDRQSSQVRHPDRVFCSNSCQAKENNQGKKNPNYRHGGWVGGRPRSVCPECGNSKDLRAKRCSWCAGRGFPIGRVHEENPLAASTARGRLLDRIEYKCANCGQRDRWKGKSLMLEMDHIDGNRRNNKVENLRWLCPNCHSQTETFRRRNGREDK